MWPLLWFQSADFHVLCGLRVLELCFVLGSDGELQTGLLFCRELASVGEAWLVA